MSKLSFRARALDASKQMPVFLADDLPDLSECASINRAVPQMPTGMEKEEEMVSTFRIKYGRHACTKVKTSRWRSINRSDDSFIHKLLKYSEKINAYRLSKPLAVCPTSLH